MFTYLVMRQIEKTYAIQAGREVRVLVSADKVDDKQSEQLAFDISQKNTNRNDLPGTSKSNGNKRSKSYGLCEVAKNYYK